MALIITRFTRFGANLGTLHITDARHVEDLDGTDELTVTCKEDLSKGDYLVWRDQQGNWREHIVDVPERWRDEDGTVYTTALCINSIAETWDDWVDEVRPNGSAQVAMERVLASSRWSAGTCTQTGTAHRTFYHKSVRESLQGIVETWGGELVTTISCDGTKVTGRSAAIVSARGNQSSAKRFTYTKDLLSIHRRVNSDNPKTRIYAYGRGEELDDSGTYGRRIGIADVNGGIPYVEDTAATAIWGRYDASGNLMPAIGVFIDEECEDPATLKEEAIAYLQRVKEPSVTYEADVIDLAAFGREWEEVALGDTVTIVDKRFSDEGLRLHGRISRLERDLLDNDTKVTFGTLTDVLAGSWASMREQVGYLTERTAGVENVVNPSSGWLDQLISSLNSQYNAAGTYHYSSFEQGEIWSSVPLDENGHATQSGGWAININGMGFRLASSLNADGSWNWRTFGTGEGFTADEITAGVIRGGQSYWNLNTGDFVISSSSTIGGHAPDDFLTDVDVSVEQTSTGANITVNGDTVTLTNGQDGATGPQGPQGIQGEKGADGTSVTVTSIQYGTSASASTQPSSWSTTAPTSLTKGTWLWVKTTYSNGDSAITKSYVGTDGEDGTSVYVKSSTKSGDTTTIVITDGTNDSTITIKDGEDGENGTNGSNGYVHTAWANSADGTTDFSTTVSAGKTYLGVYTDNTAADSTTPSAYSWSLIKGTGVTSLSPEYYLSTSSTGLAGGSWSAEQQEWQQGHYYWTRQKVTWTDGTTSYTDPVLESALNSANNCALSQHSSGTVINGSGCTIRSLTIHGKSVQDGTPSPSNPIPIQSVEGRNLFDQTAVAGAIRQGTSNASYAYWQDGVLTNVRSVGAHGYWAFDYPMESPVGAGEVLFVSFDVKLSGTNATQQVRVMLQASDSITAFTNNAYVEVAAKDTWEHFAVVRTVASGYSAGDTCYLLIEAGNSGNSVQVRNVCLSASNIGYVPYGSIAARVDGGNYIEVGRDLLTAYYINTAGKKSVDSTGLVSSVNTSSDGRTFAYANSDFFLELPAGSYMFTWFVETASTGSSCQIVIRDSANTYLIGKSSADTFSTGDSLPFTLSEQTKVGIEVKMYSATARFMLTRGTDVPTEYEPYQGSATPIDLDGNALRSLPNGTEDTLEVDGEGNVTINKHTGMSYNELVPMGAGTYYDTDCYQDFSKDFSMYIDFTRVGASRHCFVSAYANIPSLGIELNTGGYVRFYMMGNGVTDRAVGSAVPIGSECRIACMWKASEGRLYWVEEIDGSRTNGTVVPNTAPTGKCTASLRLGGDYSSSTGAGETFTPAWTQVNATPYFEEPFPDDWQSKTWLWGEDGKAVWVDEADTISTTGTMLADSEIVYPLATPQTISLGKIDLPSLPSPSFSMHVDAAVTPTLDAEWWTVDGIASTGQLSQVASDAAERIGGLEDAVSAINNAGYATRAELEATAAELMPKDNDLFKWLRIVDSTLQIGRETTDGNRFYSSYTADGLGFYAGDSTLPVTALTRELGLYAPRSTIDEQLKIGGFAFIKRSNGNLTLKYIGG